MTNSGTPGTDGETTGDSTPRDGESTQRLSIPSNLWDTGLFKPAWSRADEARTPDAAPPVASGSLLQRPEDLPGATAESDDDDPTEVEPTAEPEDAEPDGPRIDPDLVVPAALASYATGTHPAVVDDPESTAERPADDDAETFDETDADQTSPALSPIAAAEAAATGRAPQTEETAETEEPHAEEDAPSDDTVVAAAPSWATAAVAAPAAASGTEATQVVAATAPTAHAETPTAVVPAAAAPRTPEDAAQTPARKRGKGLAVLLAVVLVVALLGGGWFGWQRSQDGPVRDSFADAHGAFVIAATQLQAAETLDEVAGAGAGFADAVEQLEETRSVAGGRGSDLGSSVRRAVAVELEIARAAQELAALEQEEYAAWGSARGDLTRGLRDLQGVRSDIEAAGGSVADLPTVDLVDRLDRTVGQAASRSARQRTQRLTADLAGAERIAQLRGVGNRAATGATQLAGAVDSLVPSAFGTDELAAHQGVQDALAKLTRLKPATLNQWTPIRTQVERAAGDLPDETAAALTAALATADTMVATATEAWQAWEAESEDARTAQQEALDTVRDARGSLDELLGELNTLDEQLASFLATGAQLPADGPGGAAATTLTAAAEAREALTTQVLALGAPEELADETGALVDALAAHTSAVRSAADAAATCVGPCQLTATSPWQALVSGREAQVQAVRDAVAAWRAASRGALQEIRERELPEKPEI